MDESSGNVGWKYAAKMRDRRLRRQVLQLLFDARVNPTGWTGAITLRDAVDGHMPPGQQFESESHCIGLCRDLSIAGLTEERMSALRPGDTFGLRYLEYRITAAGLALILEDAPPVPMVDDDRIQ